MVPRDSEAKHDLRVLHAALGIGEGLLHEGLPHGVFCALPMGELRRARSTVATTRELVGKALVGKFVADVIGNYALDTVVESLVDLQAVIEWNVSERVYQVDPNVTKWVDDIESLYDEAKKAQERALVEIGRWAARGGPSDEIPAFW